ncbi:MAG: tetratricopeptide repeat protein [Armatimonadota bacterium]
MAKLCGFAGACLALAVAVAGCVGGEATKQTAGGDQGLNPIENYKQARFREAIRGLDYSSGRVTINEREAREVVPPGSPLEFDTQMEDAEALLLDNAYVESIAAFTKAVILSPESADAYVGLARSLRTKGELEMGLAALRTSLDLRPDHVGTRYLYAEFLWQNNETQESKTALEELTTLPAFTDEDRAYQGEAWRMLASAYWYDGNPRRALDAANKAVEYGVDVPPQLLDLINEALAQGGVR